MSVNDIIKDLFHLECHEANEDGTTPILVYDGIINEDVYSQIKGCRTLFLLKDVNASDLEHNENLCDWLRNHRLNPGKMDNIWINVCLWNHILEGNDVNYIQYCREDLEHLDPEKLIKHLEHVAVANIKKSKGNPEVVGDVVSIAAKVNQGLLVKEVDLIQPRLIACGGTFDQAKKIWRIPRNEVKHLSSGTPYFRYQDKLFIDVFHPSWYMVHQRVLAAYIQVVSCALRKECPDLYVEK